jgi:hypothetical protein
LVNLACLSVDVSGRDQSLLLAIGLSTATDVGVGVSFILRQAGTVMPVPTDTQAPQRGLLFGVRLNEYGLGVSVPSLIDVSRIQSATDHRSFRTPPGSESWLFAS